MPTAVLFDLDGVVVDTEGQYTRFWTEVGKRDFPHLSDFATRIKGNTLKQINTQYYADDLAKCQRLQEELVAFEQEMQYPYVPGVVEFLKQLREAGFKVAIVTSSNRAKMECLYRAHPELPSLFDAIFTAENAQRSKPAPDCYIQAAHSLGFEAKDCFVCEDSLSGLQAGRDSGATVIALATSHPKEIIASYASCVITDFQAFNVAQMCQLK